MWKSQDKFHSKLKTVSGYQDIYHAHNGIKHVFNDVDFYSWYEFGNNPAILFSYKPNYEITSDSVLGWDYHIIDDKTYICFGSNEIEYFEQYRNMELEIKKDKYNEVQLSLF